MSGCRTDHFRWLHCISEMFEHVTAWDTCWGCVAPRSWAALKFWVAWWKDERATLSGFSVHLWRLRKHHLMPLKQQFTEKIFLLTIMSLQTCICSYFSVERKIFMQLFAILQGVDKVGSDHLVLISCEIFEFILTLLWKLISATT